MSDRVPIEEQTADRLPLSPARVNHHHTEDLCDGAVEATALTAEKPFQEVKPPADEEQSTDSGNSCPQVVVGDANGACQTPVSATDSSGPSSLVTGTTSWSPEMGKDKFFFSLCREWKMKDKEDDKSELIGPQWKLSPAVAPGTFQKYCTLSLSLKTEEMVVDLCKVDLIVTLNKN